MRGLTPLERELLLEATSPSDPETEPEATTNEVAVFECLETLGRVRTVVNVTDDWEWHDWRTTDLGFLALRVCPVGEP